MNSEREHVFMNVRTLFTANLAFQTFRMSLSFDLSYHVSFVWCNFGDPFENHGKQVTKNHEIGSKLVREYSKIRGPAPHLGGCLRPPPRWGVAIGSGSCSGEFGANSVVLCDLFPVDFKGV